MISTLDFPFRRNKTLLIIATAPVPRKKEGRAARLAAIMESQGMSTEGTALEAVLQQEREALEKAVAEDIQEDLRTADQHGTNEQIASVDPAATPSSKLDAEPAGKQEANGAQKLEHAEVAQPPREDVSV